MHRILQTIRLFPTSFVVRLNSTSKVPIRNQPTIDDDDDDERSLRRKAMSAEDYIFADSKSARFKEKNQRKQKQWMKKIEQRQITPLSPLLKEPRTAPDIPEKKIIRYSELRLLERVLLLTL